MKYSPNTRRVSFLHLKIHFCGYQGTAFPLNRKISLQLIRFPVVVQSLRVRKRFLQHFQDVCQIVFAQNGLSCFWLLWKCRQSSHFLGERQTFSVSLNHYPTYFLQYFKAKAYPCHIKRLFDTVIIIQTRGRLDKHSCHLPLSAKSLCKLKFIQLCDLKFDDWTTLFNFVGVW